MRRALDSRVPHSFAFFADEWVRVDSTTSKLLRRAPLDFRRPLLKVYPHESSFPKKICPKAAPLPLVGLLNQSTLHRISMQVPQLLNSFVFGPYAEIIKALLPDGVRRVFPELCLRGSGSASFLELARKSLLDHFHDDRWIAFFWFRN